MAGSQRGLPRDFQRMKRKLPLLVLVKDVSTPPKIQGHVTARRNYYTNYCLAGKKCLNLWLAVHCSLTDAKQQPKINSIKPYAKYNIYNNKSMYRLSRILNATKTLSSLLLFSRSWPVGGQITGIRLSVKPRGPLFHPRISWNNKQNFAIFKSLSTSSYMEEKAHRNYSSRIL